MGREWRRAAALLALGGLAMTAGGEVRAAGIEDLYAAAAAGHYLALRGESPTRIERTAAAWPNGGLGLLRPGELATQVIVPGYRFVLSTARGDLPLEYRAGGRQIRVQLPGGQIHAAPVLPNARPPEAAVLRAAAVGHATAVFGRPPARVEVEPTVWTDAAYGLPRPEERVAQVRSAGWLIAARSPKFGAPPLEYRTGPDWVRIRVAGDRIDVLPLPLPGTVRDVPDPPAIAPDCLVLTRSGGIAGFNDTLTILRDGSWHGRGRGVERRGKLAGADRETVRSFLDGDLWKRRRGQYGFDPRVADGMALGFEVRSGSRSLGRYVIHKLDESIPPIYRRLSELIGLIHAPAAQ